LGLDRLIHFTGFKTRWALHRVSAHYPFAVVTIWPDYRVTAIGVDTIAEGMQICRQHYYKQDAKEAWVWSKSS
jgi:hypothetical protein